VQDTRLIFEEFVNERHLDKCFLTKLESFDASVRNVLSLIMSELRPSANALSGLLDLADEIVQREKCEPSHVFLSVQFSEAMALEGLQRKEKLKKLREVLERRRFPERTELEDAINSLQKSLRSNYNLKVKLPHELEGDSIEVLISGRCPEDFSLASDRLNGLAHSEELKMLFSILQGEL